jgi:hypothetical protein
MSSDDELPRRPPFRRGSHPGANNKNPRQKGGADAPSDGDETDWSQSDDILLCIMRPVQYI